MAATHRYVCTHDNAKRDDDANILLEHYGDKGFRTLVINAEEFGFLEKWKLCAMLNEAYQVGRRDAMEDLRNLIGLK